MLRAASPRWGVSEPLPTLEGKGYLALHQNLSSWPWEAPADTPPSLGPPALRSVSCPPLGGPESRGQESSQALGDQGKLAMLYPHLIFLRDKYLPPTWPRGGSGTRPGRAGTAGCGGRGVENLGLGASDE